MERIPDITFRQKKSNELGFEIMTFQSLLERVDSLETGINILHRIHFHFLMLITKGKGTHVVDFERYELSVGDLLFIAKEQVHAFGDNNGMEGYIILFTDQFLNKNLSQGDYLAFYRFFTFSQYPPIIGFADPEVIDLLPIISGMQHEFNRENDFARPEIIRSLLKILLLHAERTGRRTMQHPQSTEFKAFASFQQLLSKEYTQTRDAKKYASLLNFSYRYLNDVCKEFTQKTVKAVIDGYVILEAKRQLSQVALPIKEISYALGFDEPTNFVKYFKKQTGVSPKVFREQITE
ncbi:helix-turn-helix domain-containing protein [Marinilabiliaceae bacterium JC017]|nr:helix-turn-helix domain-containing protein [Marinilabiliaceae bacterium JC017]